MFTNLLDVLAQVGVVVCGITSSYLIARKNKWGIVAGLVASPFWFYIQLTHELYVAIVLNLFYTYNGFVGLKYWFKKGEDK